MHLLHLDAGDVGDGGEPRAQALGVRRQVGHHVERGVEPGGHRGRQLGLLLGGADVGGEVGGEGLVHLGQRLAQPGGLGGEVAADLVGVEVGLGEQVAHAGQRGVPAVGGGAQELLEHRQLQRARRSGPGASSQP